MMQFFMIYLFCCFLSALMVDATLYDFSIPFFTRVNASERTRRIAAKYFHLASGGVTPSCDSLLASTVDLNLQKAHQSGDKARDH